MPRPAREPAYRWHYQTMGLLARHRVLYFATHGLLAGESEGILKSKAEPTLMTPPKNGASLAELEKDDRLFTAS